eukprot:3465255-Rhodomonas_salina.4
MPVGVRRIPSPRCTPLPICLRARGTEARKTPPSAYGCATRSPALTWRRTGAGSQRTLGP